MTTQSPLSGDTVFQPLPGLEAAIHIDGMTLRHPKTGAYFSLNGTGAFIWKLMGEPHPLSAIKESAAAHFGAPRDTADPSIEAFVASLVSEGLLVPKASPEEAPQ
jgi:hypothetical protein